MIEWLKDLIGVVKGVWAGAKDGYKKKVPDAVGSVDKPVGGEEQPAADIAI